MEASEKQLEEQTRAASKDLYELTDEWHGRGIVPEAAAEALGCLGLSIISSNFGNDEARKWLNELSELLEK